jgi:hypothetical protein
MVDPTIFETRTLSTLKLSWFLGHTSMHASAHVFARMLLVPELLRRERALQPLRDGVGVA